MFSKTWRVHSIFTNINTMKKVKYSLYPTKIYQKRDIQGIHDSHLLAIVGLLLFIDLIFLISWQIFDPIHRIFVYAAPRRLKVFIIFLMKEKNF